MAQNLDPNSDGRGVLQFKTGLMSVIKVLFKFSLLSTKTGHLEIRKNCFTQLHYCLLSSAAKTCKKGWCPDRSQP